MKNEYTRNVSNEMLRMSESETIFKSFIDFAKFANDLELCFRGSSSYFTMILEVENGRKGRLRQLPETAI